MATDYVACAVASGRCHIHSRLQHILRCHAQYLHPSRLPMSLAKERSGSYQHLIFWRDLMPRNYTIFLRSRLLHAHRHLPSYVPTPCMQTSTGNNQ